MAVNQTVFSNPRKTGSIIQHLGEQQNQPLTPKCRWFFYDDDIVPMLYFT